MQKYQYDVFISYRHKPLDSAIAQGVLNRLESFRMPASLVKQGKQGVRRVFRDTEELSVSRVLTDTIRAALTSTKCLIVICSTDTPSSEWVDREVENFIQQGRAEYIYPLLITGDPETSFPKALKKVPDIAQRVMDVRCASPRARDILNRFYVAMPKVVARVADCPEADLRREATMSKRSAAVKIAAGMTALFTVVGISCGMFWQQAEQYRESSRNTQAATMELLEKLTYELPDRLAAYPGTYARLSQILCDNTVEINEILDMAEDKAPVRMEMAANYEKLATAQQRMGYLSQAEEYELQAISLMEEQYALDPAASAAALASARNNLGIVYLRSGNLEQARAAFDEAMKLLPDRQGGNRSVAASILANQASLLLSVGDYEGALAAFAEADALFDELPGSAYGKLLLNWGTTLSTMGRYSEAEEVLRRGVQMYDLSQGEVSIDELSIRSQLALCLNMQGKVDEAAQAYAQAESEAQVLMQASDNREALSAAASFYNLYGNFCNMQQRYAQASPFLQQAHDLYAAIAEGSQATPDIRLLAQACMNIGENAFKEGAYDVAKESFDEGLSLYASVCEQLGDACMSEYLSWRSYRKLIFDGDYPGALDDAATAVELQPESVFACYYYGYALMYNGYNDACEQVFTILASLGEGTGTNVRLDLKALSDYGLSLPEMDRVLDIVGRG